MERGEGVWGGERQRDIFWKGWGSGKSTPLSSFPAIGCPPTNNTGAGRYSSAQLMTCVFVLATSVTTDPGEATVAMFCNSERIAPTAVAKMINSAPRTASVNASSG